MNGFTKILVLASVAAVASAADLQPRGRDQKSLLSVFPFGDQNHHAHHDDHHHDHHGPLTGGFRAPAPHQNAPRGQTVRQERQEEEVALDIGTIAAAAERCVEKVVMEHHTVYDDHITCKHSYDKKCHTTYTTDYEPQQEEECDETFTKSCFIEYKQVASQEPVKFCYTPLGCEGEGDPEEVTVYESQCSTHYHEHDVVDDVVTCRTEYDTKCRQVTQGYTTEEECDKWPKQVCDKVPTPVTKVSEIVKCEKKPRTIEVRGACTPVPQEEECYDKTETVVQEVPEETCNLEPQKTCKFVTKLVPLLKPAEECVDIPKEVCSRQRIPRPDKEPRPVVKKWCYVPTEESGLA